MNFILSIMGFIFHNTLFKNNLSIRYKKDLSDFSRFDPLSLEERVAYSHVDLYNPFISLTPRVFDKCRFAESGLAIDRKYMYKEEIEKLGTICGFPYKIDKWSKIEFLELVPSNIALKSGLWYTNRAR